MPAVGWIFRGGLAAAWKGPELKAGDNAVAIESIEIAHEGLRAGPAHPAGGRLMITIEHLEVLFDAERERDEAVFARAVRAATWPATSGAGAARREDAVAGARERPDLGARGAW